MSEKKGKEKTYCPKCVPVWAHVIVCTFVGGRVQGVMCVCVCEVEAGEGSQS